LVSSNELYYSVSSYCVSIICCSTSAGLVDFAFSHSSALMSPPACSLILFAREGPIVGIAVSSVRLLSLMSSILFRPALYIIRARTLPTPSSPTSLTSSGFTPFELVGRVPHDLVSLALRHYSQLVQFAPSRSRTRGQVRRS